MLVFDRLQTPPDDGDVLIEPEPWTWPALIDINRGRREMSPFELAGKASSEVVRQTRRALYGGDCADRIVLACGHQPAFVHPGVWAKHVVVRHAAEQLGGIGVDFVVDHDAPPSFALTVPAIDGDGVYRSETIPVIDGAAGSAYEGQPALTGDQVNRLEHDVRSAMADTYDSSMIPTYLKGYREAADSGDIVDQHLAGRVRVDRSLSADLTEIRISRVFRGPFLADLLIHAERFAHAYNEALHEYRRQNRIRDSRRPLPDLIPRGTRQETALWAYQPCGRRRRLLIECTGKRLSLFAEGEAIGTVTIADVIDDPDAALASLSPWVIRPRALTLTLWARLLACDLFIHGIGGAKYDRITDGIIERFYQRQPPAFACVSATLRLPLPVRPADPRALLAARHDLRDVRYNPDRYLTNPPADLMAKRAALIRESDRLRTTQGPRAARRETFLAIQRVNGELLGRQPEVPQALADRVSRVERELASSAVARSREHFYLLQSPDRLRKLAERLRQAADLPA